MQYALTLAALAASVYAQYDLPEEIFNRAPDASTPGSCSKTYQGGSTDTFTFLTVPLGKQGINQGNVVCGKLAITLTDGDLVDQAGYTGSVVDNYQFQFDGPNGPQDTAIYTAGWSTCSNGSIALGDQFVFYTCANDPTASAEGFANIYDRPLPNRPDCEAVTLNYHDCNDSGNIAKRAPDGQNGRNADTAEMDDSSSSGSSSSSASSSASSTSEASSASSEMSSVSSMMTMMTSSAAPTATTSAVVAPVPASNTTVAASGTGAATPTGPTSAPSPFTGAGSMVAACKGFVVLIAGAAAFALF